MANKVALTAEAKQLEVFVHEMAAPLDQIFDGDEVLTPMWFGKTPTGNVVFATPWGNDQEKTAAVAIVGRLLKQHKATAYALMTEAWTLLAQGKEMPESIQRGGKVSSHPDRREAVVMIAEDKYGNCIHYRRYILRPEHGKATLSPYELEHCPKDAVKGLLVGLLED